MGILDSLERGVGVIRAAVSGSPAPWDDYWYSQLGVSSASGMRVNAESAKRIAAVLACVGVIGRAIGMMPCKIYSEAPDGSKRAVNHHPIYDLLYVRPNKFQTAFEFRQMMQGHLELRGNAYAEIIPGKRGAVDQLIPMHPDRVRVERIKPSGRLRYVYDDPLQGKTRVLLGAPDAEVLHLRNYSDDGSVGQSTVAMGVDVFGTALARQDYAARFFQNDARPPAVFTGGAFKNKIAEQEFVESWQRGHTAENRGKIGMLPPGMDIKVLGVNPSDSEMLDGMKLSRVEIAGIFGVPPHLIGETEKASTYASVEQFNIQFVVYCLLPRLVLWEQAIQRDLIVNSRYYSKFSVATLLRGDTASRYAAYAQAITIGWLNPDEARAMEDLNPIPGGAGQTYWRQAALTPLSNTAGVSKNTETPQDTGHDGSGAEPDNAALDRLRLLASAAADRCTRKEIAALRKLAERGATGYEAEEFYSEHVAFVQQVLQLGDEQVIALRQEFWVRAGEFSSAVSSGRANDFIDALAARCAKKVVDLAMEGVR